MLFSECDVLPARQRVALVPPTPVLETPNFPLCSLKICIVFRRQKVVKMEPTGTPKITKNHNKNKKKRVPKGHLNSVSKKTLNILYFGRPWDLQNRAETQARTSFSLICLITKECSKLHQKTHILDTPGTPKSQKM